MPTKIALSTLELEQIQLLQDRAVTAQTELQRFLTFVVKSHDGCPDGQYMLAGKELIPQFLVQDVKL